MNIQKIRIFVEKKENFRVEAEQLRNDLNNNLNLNIQQLRLINLYDIFNINEELFEKAKKSVFSEPVTDDIFDTIDLQDKIYFATEFLPGQFAPTLLPPLLLDESLILTELV